MSEILTTHSPGLTLRMTNISGQKTNEAICSLPKFSTNKNHNSYYFLPLGLHFFKEQVYQANFI